ncbi:MAG: hypothetical protein ABSF52_14310 [Syntrophobacteraceae bacterium]|jgi:hypothetical protein
MKNFLAFGLAVWFFLVPLGCSHTPDSPDSTPRHLEIATAQTNGMPAQEVTVAQANRTPAVEVSETTFDFGVVKEGDDYLHAFKIRNRGTGVLAIRKVPPG